MRVLVHGDINKSKFKSYIDFDEKIKFRCAVNGTSSCMYVRKNYRYTDIKYIGVGICPLFYRNDGKSHRIPKNDDAWTNIYGKYIIASDSMNHTMFVCRYVDTVWNILFEKCNKTANKIMNEEEYNQFLQDRIRTELQTEKDNNYEEIINLFDGFVN